MLNNPKHLEISILDSDPFEIKKTLELLKSLSLKYVHLDIGDTSFIPNITFGLPFLKKLLKYDFIFDLHFMVKDPLLIIKQLVLPRNSTITIHYEIPNFEKVYKYLCDIDVQIGIAIKPSTNIEHKINVDKILIMTVEPGFGGQKMIVECGNKIGQLRKSFNCKIGIDGGVNNMSIKKVISADYFVVGSYFFSSKDKKKCIDELLDIINT